MDFMEYDAAESETIEDLGRRGFSLIQKKTGFRYGEDTVFLAWFAAQTLNRKKRLQKTAELGANCGAASILLAARRDDVSIDGIEIQPEASRIFAKNILLNHLEERVSSISMDIRDLGKEKSDIGKATYDLVFFNPPYHVPGRGPLTNREKESTELLEARFEVNGTFEDFARAADWLLLPQGKAVLVQRVSRLPEVLFFLKRYRIEPMRLRFIHTRPEKPAVLFMLSGQKNGKPGGFQVMPPLIIYNDDHSYTDEMKTIYSDEAK
jgi:tRNA1Val (adenine37-N6)-methyltransferase